MPGYKVHIVGGVATFIGLMMLCSRYGTPIAPFITLQWLAATVLGALFPDVDIKSKGQGIFYKGMLLFLLFLFWTKQFHLFVIMSFLALVPLLVRHRGMFHRPWFVVVLPLSVAFITGVAFPVYGASFFYNACFFSAGALSHIMLDKLG